MSDQLNPVIVENSGKLFHVDDTGTRLPLVDETRLLPKLESVSADKNGHFVAFKATVTGTDDHTLLYCPFDADFTDHSSYARTVTHDTSRAGLSISLERNKFGTGSLSGTGYTTAGAVYVLMSTPIGAANFTIHTWIYVTSAASKFGIFSTYGEAGSGVGTPGYGVDGLACWIDTDGTLKLYKASAHFSSYWYDDDSGNKLAEAAMPSDYLNRWVHIAVARSGNIWMLFADGSLLNSNSKEFNATQPYLRIGSADSLATAYGNIDEFIVLDYAKWTTDFEPPTQPATTLTKSYEVSDKTPVTTDSPRLLPDPSAYGQNNNGWRVGLQVRGIEDRDDFLCLYPLNEIVQGLPLDATGKTTATNQGVALELVEDAHAFEGKAVRRSSSQNSSIANKLVIPMPSISGPFTVDIRFKAGKGSSGVGGTGTTYWLAGVAVTTPAGSLGYHCGDVSPFHAVNFSALGYGADSHGLPWKVFENQGWYWFRMCRNDTAMYVFMNGEKINATTSSDALITIPAGNWTILPSDMDSDVLIDEVRITNTCESIDNYAVPTESFGSIERSWELYKPIDETRLNPVLSSVSSDKSGHPVVFDYQTGIDAATLCLLHLDEASWTDAIGKNTPTQHGSVAKVSSSGYFDKALDLSGNLSSGSLSWLTIPWVSAYNVNTWTMEFFAKPTKSLVNFMFLSFGNSQGSYFTLGSQSLGNLYMGNGSGTYTADYTFNLNTWYWIVIQYDGSAVKVYVDTQLVLQGNFTPNFINQDLQLGNLNLVNNQDNTFVGLIDEFRWSSGIRYLNGVMTIPTQPFGSPTVQYKVSEEPYATEQTVTDLTGTVTALTTRVTEDEKWLLPTTAADNQLVQYRQSSGKWVAIPTTDIITEEQLGKIDSLEFADSLTFTADELDDQYVFTANADTTGIPYGAIVQLVDSTTGAVLTNADGVTIEWTSAGDLRIDFSAYYQAVVYGESTSSSSSDSSESSSSSSSSESSSSSSSSSSTPINTETLALFHFDSSTGATASGVVPVNETGNGVFSGRDFISQELPTFTLGAAIPHFGSTVLETQIYKATDVYVLNPAKIITECNTTGATGYTLEYFIRSPYQLTLKGFQLQFISNNNYNFIFQLPSASDDGDLSGVIPWLVCTGSGLGTDNVITKEEPYTIQIEANQYVHIAAVLESDYTFRFFVNGVKQVEFLPTEWSAAGKQLPDVFLTGTDFEVHAGFSCTGPSTSPVTVYLDELRLSGIARYQDNFTPPTAPFTLENAVQTLSTTIEAAEPVALTTDITGSFEVKFAGNFVSNAATTGGSTAKAIAYPLLLKMDPYDKPMHLEIQYSKDAGYATTIPLINTKTTASDRVYVMGDGGTAFEQCPETGFAPEVFSNAPIMVNMAKLGTLDGFYYIRYRWLSNTSDTSVSDWYRTVYPAYTDVGF